MFTKKELAECVFREVDKRRRFYPKFVAERKMRQIEADKQLSMMEEIGTLLMKLPEEEIARYLHGRLEDKQQTGDLRK